MMMMMMSSHFRTGQSSSLEVYAISFSPPFLVEYFAVEYKAVRCLVAVGTTHSWDWIVLKRCGHTVL